MNVAEIQAEDKVVVAMSGGVDSSVAALLLSNQGIDVIGVSMQVWDYRKSGGCSTRATCCAPDDFTDARKVAAKLGVPYYVFDFEDTFRAEVIDKFVASYAEALTPNPCVDCNNKVKFRKLRERANSLGFGTVATGHYAVIKEQGDGWHVYRSKDLDKDQTYFLYGLKQSELKHTLFPVGGYTKEEVRELARAAGLVTASKPESQDICFVSGSVSDFLVKLGKRANKGFIKNQAGEIVGEHDGIQNFTIGQRRGLGVGGFEKPLYVIELDAVSNTVVVGEKEALERGGFFAFEGSFVAPQVLSGLVAAASEPFSFRCLAQLRHRHAGVLVDLTVFTDLTMRATFVDSWAVVAPGQAAAFYCLDNHELLGGGVIRASFS